MKILITVILICFGVQGFSQNENAIETTAIEIKPRVNQRFFQPLSFFDYQTKEEWLKSGDKGVTVRPNFEYRLSGGVSQTETTNSSYEAYGSGGVDVFLRNLRIDLQLEGLQANLGKFPSRLTDSLGVISGFGVASQNDLGYLAYNITGKVNWQVSKHFNAEFGRGTNFWGNGYRSMVIGETHVPYPYLKLTTSAWRFKYMNLFMQLKDFHLTNDLKDARTKYITQHAIDFEVSDNVSLTIFESVVWQASDTLSNRGIELNYLNPVIFYRPVEFAQGSADNVLLGIAARVKLDRKWLVYGQLFLDEFLLSEVRARSGWWGNKIGLQLGLKTKDLLPGFWGYSEVNLARPFTYSHGSVLQNYGQLNQSVAHPLGNNFIEWSTGAQLIKKDWIFSNRTNIAQYGRDVDGENYGGDIYTSYRGPVTPRGNNIAQGNVHHSYFTQFRASRKISSKHDLRLFGMHTWRHVKSKFETENEHLLLIGIESSPFRLDRKSSSGNNKLFVQDF